MVEIDAFTVLPKFTILPRTSTRRDSIKTGSVLSNKDLQQEKRDQDFHKTACNMTNEKNGRTILQFTLGNQNLAIKEK